MKKQITLALFILLAIGVLLSAAQLPQANATVNTVTITVLDQNAPNNPVVGATVELQQSGVTKYTGTTDANGQVVFYPVNGAYTIEASLETPSEAWYMVGTYSFFIRGGGSVSQTIYMIDPPLDGPDNMIPEVPIGPIATMVCMVMGLSAFAVIRRKKQPIV